ncbi:hypothetical protein PQR66_18890 [Paraburkholderia agricolaris]|uniref:Uncharacterized protein n=1 Tax=Paraburkholderia agricolaris TaxID=2152888 RepID=A0ABW8ZQ50_9BURK
MLDGTQPEKYQAKLTTHKRKLSFSLGSQSPYLTPSQPIHVNTAALPANPSQRPFFPPFIA